jgi:hypothetical protein
MTSAPASHLAELVELGSVVGQELEGEFGGACATGVRWQRLRRTSASSVRPPSSTWASLYSGNRNFS